MANIQSRLQNIYILFINFKINGTISPTWKKNSFGSFTIHCSWEQPMHTSKTDQFTPLVNILLWQLHFIPFQKVIVKQYQYDIICDKIWYYYISFRISWATNPFIYIFKWIDAAIVFVYIFLHFKQIHILCVIKQENRT